MLIYQGTNTISQSHNQLQNKNSHINFFIFSLWQIQALSGDFQHACRKMNAEILLGMRRCAMSIILFLKFYNFIKGIMRIHSIFKKP